MSTPPTPDTPTISPLMRALLNNRRALRAGIFAVAGLFIAYLVFQMRQGFGGGIPLRWLYAGAMALVALLVGTIDLVGDDSDEKTQVAKLRLELMTLGGVLGLGTTLLGFL